MFKSLVALALAGAMSVPAAAQTAPATPTATNQAQAAKPQMVKKRVCEEGDDNPYSRLKTKTCKTVMVPADQGALTSSSSNKPSSAPAPQPN
jgi:curli biogenesis system outer membrane secretion channel CsgG